MSCVGCDPKCKECVGSQASNTICAECNECYVLYNDTCFVTCPDGYEVNPLKPTVCTEKVYTPVSDAVISDGSSAVIVNNAEIPDDSCLNVGFKFEEDLYMFPVICLSAIACLVGLASYCYEKQTKLTAPLLMLLSPVEVFGLFLQVIVAYKTTGGSGVACISADSGDEIKRRPFVFWVTMVSIILLYIFNISYSVQITTNKKLKEDVKFTVWRAKYMFSSYLFMRLFSLFISFKMNCIGYSYFLGRKRYFAEFDRKKPYFRII